MPSLGCAVTGHPDPSPIVFSTLRPSTAHANVEQVKIHASRPRDDIDAEPHRFTVDCTDYTDGVAQAEDSIPEGWILTHIQVDRD